MAFDASKYDSYSQVKARLDEIAAQVADEAIPLDDALDLYDEAVTLALRASDFIEIDEDEGDDVSVDASRSDSLAETQGPAQTQE